MIVVGLTGGIGAGKSTVSTMLAERGAAIVDGDQTARDLQAAGSPVLAAMAERFGEHIINDDGTLDRAAVAKIVFSDEDALKDLNGIVHPAMQAEIQRQIDVHADTDRVVVLDFPLLAENPRKDLAATIVVDIETQLAVERAVGRGMEEDDVRNRINSQVSREDRLAIATHVIDNNGDYVELVAQVDALWRKLEALPQTGTAQVARPDAPGGTLRDWVFGYGSLVSPKSLARTIRRVAVPGENFHEAVLAGYGRRWNYGVMHITATWTSESGETIDDGTIVALGVIPADDESVLGVVAQLSEEELAALDHRERNYTRVDVTEQVASEASIGGRVFTYVPRNASIETYQAARDAGRAGIRRTYWDLVQAAYGELGADQLERYRSETPDPDVPLVDIESASER